jgi:phosphoribosylglycinamide formyltransferase 1
MQKIKLGILISGRGSNLQALIDACKNENFPAQISVVISNVADVFGLERAKAANIPTETVPHKNYKTREDFEKAIQKILMAAKVDVVCLAGFMRIVTPGFISKWPGRMINIHPSLLPDYKGLHTHERVLQDGKKETGCTVHYVIPEMDSGPIIVQKTVHILPDDTPSTLAERVLAQEHVAYPEAVRIVAQKFL